MKKLFSDLANLEYIHRSVRDRAPITQEQIAKELNVSNRTVRYWWVFLKGMGAPLEIPGHFSVGWQYSKEWDFWQAIQGKTDDILENM